jgi:hypothetical protein
MPFPQAQLSANLFSPDHALHLNHTEESRLSLGFDPLHRFGKRGARIKVMGGVMDGRPFGGAPGFAAFH